LHKNEFNKKNKELHNLKIAYIKLDEENKKNIKIIEEIIIETGRNQKNSELVKMDQEMLESEIRNMMTMSNPSEKTLFKLKEVKIYSDFLLQIK
jgi:hypothetical protein